jgi:hypothetical protein
MRSHVSAALLVVLGAGLQALISTAVWAQNSLEYKRLLEQALSTQNPDEQVALGERVLKVLPPTSADPVSKAERGMLWAVVGLGYLGRSSGKREENARQAVTAFEMALTLVPKDGLPTNWATIQKALGDALRRRAGADLSADQERAIAAYEASLVVRTRTSHPEAWAQLQAVLGDTYYERIKGNRGDNLERAIAAYGGALGVVSQQALPQVWAHLNHNLGVVFHAQPASSRMGNDSDQHG